ncbi:CpaD family pilus assembly lipoprotein [Bradyrhizobium sp. Arg62]|uniref:CpaD family pilus assembly lipoprotein n=1 Tax=Bradyrhizobium TaxID=374 RepID=UPI001E57FA2D|nr:MULTISPECIES: CpaD family pilus assembly lipoprotein [Bradyrhizobium]MCC8938341.1 CpaD family pilus assembly lipoprotein [Bradyrhizobium ivorense]MCC8948288.1 CpaD family pilus assembly lipoprotein [Bradyrhizobium brasilense]
MTLRQLCHLIGIAATLGGCANSASVHYGPREQAIQVEQKSRILFLQSLRGPETHRLRSFIATASRGRRDALHVDVTGSPRLIAQVAHEARAMGVAPYNIRLSASPLDLPARSGVRIEAITFEAHPPPCPSLSIVGPTVNDNSFDPTLGCSTRSNLATMVNDPLDLLDNRSIMPSNGDRAAIPVASYRTVAPRNKSNEEDGAGNRAAPEAPGATTRDVQPPR